MTMTRKHIETLVYALVVGAVAACASVPPAPPAQETDSRWVCENHLDRVQYLFGELDLERPGLAGVRAAVEREDWPGACDSLVAYYRRCDAGSWLRRRALPAPDPSAAVATQAKAEKTVADVYEINSVEGRVPRTKEGRLDWNYRGPNDSKSWALGLHQHDKLAELARAYFKTNNISYVGSVDATIRDWVLSNPPPATTVRDANWSALVASGRVRQWDDIFYVLQDVDAFSPATRILMLSSIPDHARVLIDPNKPEQWGPGTMVGLVVLSASWPEFASSSDWLDHAVAQLLQEVDKRFYPDLVHKQLTAHYHRRMAMYYEEAVGTLQKAGVSVAPGLAQALEGMWDYLAYTMRPDGYGPLNNDSDHARVDVHIERALGTFAREDWTYITTNGQSGTRPERLSVAYPWAGHVVMRSGWEADSHWSFFDAGPWGALHQHHDKLHLSLSAYGRDLLVDAGRYTYEADEYRAFFTGSRAHNVILVDDGGQRPDVKEVAGAQAGDWCVLDPRFDYARGAFTAGFEGVEGDVAHQRAVMYVRNHFWIVVDRIVTDRPRDIEVLWRFHPSCGVEIEQADVVTNDVDKGNLRVAPVSDLSWAVRVVSGSDEPHVMAWYSPKMNIKEPAPTAVYSARIESSRTFAWILTPASGRVSPVDASIIDAGESGLRVRIGSTTAGGREMVVTVPLESGRPSLSQ